MSDPVGRQRRGAHRTRHDPFRWFVLAALALVVLAGSLYTLGRDDGSVATTSASRTGAPALGGPTGLPLPVSPRPTDTSSSSTEAAPSAAASRRPGPPSPEPSATRPTSATDDVRAVEVVVLNQTPVRGLAASAADQLRRRGWQVPSVGNFRGSVSATTVYYPRGRRAAALAAAADLPGPDRVRERFGNLPPTRLTVVLAADFPAYV